MERFRGMCMSSDERKIKTQMFSLNKRMSVVIYSMPCMIEIPLA
jgi:hypothetical protein